jgi:hypothetical protein
MAKTNYHQARRQKEMSRKARQQEKLAKKQRARLDGEPAADPAIASADATPVDAAPVDAKEPS